MTQACLDSPNKAAKPPESKIPRLRALPQTCVSAPAIFRNSKIYAVAFVDCRLIGADFQFSELHNVRFVNCDLTGAQFGNVTMGTVRFENSTLLDVGGVSFFKGATVQGPGSMELALSLAREVGINFE